MKYIAKPSSARTVARTLVGALVVALGVAVVAGFAAPAGAATGCNPDGSDYGQVGAKEDAALSTGPFSRGNRSLMYAGGTADCQRVSSIYVQAPEQRGFVEFGWVVGLSRCTNTTNTIPRLFYWVKNEASGIEHCKLFSSINPTPGQSAVYRIEDTNATTTWNAIYNGAAVQTGIDLDFSRGWPVVGMERGDSADSGYAVWDELFEFHDSNGWTYWDHPSKYVDNDPTYAYKQYSVHKLASELP
ncbi:MAG: hypothetical protein ACJ72O_15675 [Marmoricola sp.]